MASSRTSSARARSREGRTKTVALPTLIAQYAEVQLATLVDAPPRGDGWVHEIKFDGYRLLAYLANGEVALRTRNGNDWTSQFPSIVTSMQHLDAQDAVLDLEAVVLDAKGKSGFQQLQGALGVGGKRNRIVAFVFDLLHLDGEPLTTWPLLNRKERLAALLATGTKHPALRYSEHVTGSGDAMFQHACEKQLEGIISKEASAPYVTGRQRSWLKSKCTKRQEFIIIGYSDPRSGERALGALYLGYKKDGALRYAGKVGTGFSMQSARALIAKLMPAKMPVLTRRDMPGMTSGEWTAIHWVKLTLLCEVSFTEWTSDGRIRHPAFQGLREDKTAAEVRQELPVPVAARSAKGGTSAKLIVDGVTITHPERVISDVGQITKGELATYYGTVATAMLPGIIRRPLSLLRCPEGVGKECFYQRSPGRGLGKGVFPFPFTHNGKSYEYLYIEDEQGLLEVIQMGAIELHPWGSRVDAIDTPDRMIFDLDPAPDVPFAAVKLAALDIRQRLERHGLKANLRTTGGKGLHVWVPLAERARWDRVKAFAAGVAHEMVADLPNVYIATMTKAKRTGKIFVDYFRNDYTATAIADYAVRARPGAPVALPLAWAELPGLERADQFSIRDVIARMQQHKKRPTPVKPQRLP